MKYSGWLLNLLMPVSIAMAFLWAPAAEGLGESSRIIFFHVPAAWAAALGFVIAGVFSLMKLFSPARFFLVEEKAKNAVALGMLFTVAGIISGAIWAKLTWGAYWNWDPRQTSIVILMLIYIAYFSLWNALEGNEARGKTVSAYLVIALVLMPFFFFVVPRLYPTLHPDPVINPEKKVNLDSAIRLTLLFSSIAFTLLFFKILSVMNRISIINHRITESYDDEQ
jgi:heme exporter protein C